MSEPPAGSTPSYDPQQGPYGQWQQPNQYGQWNQPGPYGQYPQPGGAPPPTRPTITLGSLLGARARRRPDARFGSALAGAGAALALAGGLVWSVGYFAAGFGLDLGDDESSSPSVHGESRRFLGVGVFLALTVLGYALVVLRRRGALATAGTVASALGVPIALGFAFLDLGSTFRGGAFPVNVDAVYLISIAAWIVSYLAVPGARGRAVYLALAAGSLPTYIAIKASGGSVFQAGVSVASGGLGGGRGVDTNTGTVATLTLVFGLGYYAVAALLDRTGRGGVAIGLLFPAFVTTLSGISLAADDFGQVGTGVTLILIGLIVTLYGARFGRRFTTWAWAAAAVVGVAAIVAKLGDDRYTAIGLVLIALGAAIAVAGQMASGALHEEPDVVEEPVPAR